MQITDLPAVVKLQDRCYSDELYEAPEVVKSRFLSFPDSCWVATYHDKLWAYLFCYPSHLGQVAALGSAFCQVLEPDCLYLHDMAVSGDARGVGVASALFAHAEEFARAHGLSALALIAVQNSATFWQRFGFQNYAELSRENLQKLASYPLTQANYLVKNLEPLS